MATPQKIIHIAEIAEMLRLPLSTLRLWRHRNEGPPLFTIGRRVVGYEHEVLAWLQEQHDRTLG